MSLSAEPFTPWLAGPLRIRPQWEISAAGVKTITVIRMEFAGVLKPRDYRRWTLSYHVADRRFTVSALADQAEAALSKHIAAAFKVTTDRFAQSNVLKEKSMERRLRAMLTEELRAELLEISIADGRV